MGVRGFRSTMIYLLCCLVGDAFAGAQLGRSDLSARQSKVNSPLVQMNVRHHLIPGLKLNAKPPSMVPSKTGTTSEKKLAPLNSEPKSGAAVSGLSSKRVAWDSECQEPMKVSFFGDYWVAPHSPAVDQKDALLDGLRPLLAWGDFNVVNFEGSLTKSNTRAFPKFPFALKQAPDSLKWLSRAGVKHFTRANNHSMDFGWAGAQETSAALRAAGLHFTGVGQDLGAALQPMWLEKNGTKVAVISLTTTYPAEAWASDKRPGVAFPRYDLLRKTINSARSTADFVVVVFHWGEELKPYLRPHQSQHAEFVLRAGADLVLGHHAHLAQKIDIEPDNGMIVYGLGNFIFTSLSRDAKFGLGSHIEFCRSDAQSNHEESNRFRMVLTPLMTDNRITGYRSRMMTLGEFLPFAREYLKKGYFSPELEFFVPGEDRVQTLAEWLQPRKQASKEGQGVH